MASSATPKTNGSTQKKLVTYGKTPVKRQRIDATTTFELDSPASPQTSKRSKSPAPALTSLPRAAQAATISSSLQQRSVDKKLPYDDRHGAATESNASQNISAVRKRKRPQSATLGQEEDGPLASRRPGTLDRDLPAGASYEQDTMDRSKTKLSSAYRTEGKAGVSSLKSTYELSDLSKPIRHGQTPSNGISPSLGSSPPTASQNATSVSKKPVVRRPRLIDTLAAQRSPSPENTHVQQSLNDTRAPTDLSRKTSTHHTALDRDARAHTSQSSEVLKGRKVKVTYSQSRSLYAEPRPADEATNDMDMGVDPFLAGPILSDQPKSPSPTLFAFPDDDDDDGPNVAIKSVHELRRAGANNRFSDEMEDLLSRIGIPTRNPSTMRRNALLELATKLDGETFFGQFRDHGARDQITRQIGEENDIVSGFGLSAALVIFLTSSLAPSLLRQLAEEGLGRMLGRLLDVDEDIDVVVSRKEANASKTMRVSIGRVKTYLLNMKIWRGYDLSRLSPRTLALRLLGIFCSEADTQHMRDVIEQVGPELHSFAIASSRENTETSVDSALTVSILEVQSSVTTSNSAEASLLEQRSKAAAFFLRSTLSRWPARRTEADSATLRLAINTTNTAPGAAAFGDSSVLRHLASCIGTGITALQKSVDTKQLDEEVYSGLLLILGVFINIMEHCAHARPLVDSESLEGLVSLYLDNRSAMSEADSVEKSKLSVAFGYLSVLLGYVSMATPVRRLMESKGQRNGIQSLIGSIQEFIDVYKNVDGKFQQLEGLVHELRLQQAQR